MAVTIELNIYKTATLTNTYSQDGTYSDPIFPAVSYQFDGDIGESRDVILYGKNDGTAQARNIVAQVVDKDGASQVTWTKLAQTQAGLPGAAAGASYNAGNINAGVAFSFWMRVTVPAGTSAEDKTDMRVRLTGSWSSSSSSISSSSLSSSISSSSLSSSSYSSSVSSSSYSSSVSSSSSLSREIELISCDNFTNRIYLHSGITDRIIRSFAAPHHRPSGVTYDGNNLISADAAKQKIFIHAGLQAALNNSFAAPSAANRGIALLNAIDMVTLDETAAKIYFHHHKTATVTSSIATATGADGITYDGTNLIVVRMEYEAHEEHGKVFIHSGQTAAISSSFDLRQRGVTGVAWDFTNTNLVISDNIVNRIITLSGKTATVLTSFDSPDTLPTALEVIHSLSSYSWSSSSSSSSISSLSSSSLSSSSSSSSSVAVALISSDSFTDRIYLHVDTTAAIRSSFASGVAIPIRLGFDNQNVLVIDPDNNKLITYSGFSGVVKTSIAISANCLGLTYDGHNFITSDTNQNTIRTHSGRTAVIAKSFPSPRTYPSCLVYADGNLVSGDSQNPDRIFLHRWITAEVTSSFAAPGTALLDFAYDGMDLISMDQVDALVYVHSGITSTIRRTFVPPSVIPQGLTFARSVSYSSSSSSSSAATQMITSDTTTDRIYIHVDTAAPIKASYASGLVLPKRLAWDNHNVICFDRNNAEIITYSGHTAVIKASISVGNTTDGVAYDGRNFVETDSGTQVIRVHVGKTAAIRYWFGAPATFPSAVVYTGLDLVSGDSVADRIYVHSQINQAIRTSFASPAADLADLGYTGTDLLSADTVTVRLYRHSGITATIKESFAPPAVNPAGITYVRSISYSSVSSISFSSLEIRLISSDNFLDRIYLHHKVTQVIITSFASPGAYPSGVAYDNSNLVSADADRQLIYIHNGLTSGIGSSFAAPSTNNRGVAFDGTNLLSVDEDLAKVFVHSGKTAVVFDSFITCDNPMGITWDGANVIIVRMTYEEEHGKVFIHSGKTAVIKQSFNVDQRGLTGVVWDHVFQHLVISDNLVDRIFVLAGKTATVVRSFDSPDKLPTALEIVYSSSSSSSSSSSYLVQLITADYLADRIFLHDGLSSDIIRSFASPGQWPKGLAYDNHNLISCDTGTHQIYVHDGISATIGSSFASPGNEPRGLTYDGKRLLSIDHEIHRTYIHKGVAAAILKQWNWPAHFQGATELGYNGTAAVAGSDWHTMVHQFNPPTNILTNTIPTGGDLAQAVTVDNSSNLLRCEWDPGHQGVITVCSGLSGTVTSTFKSPDRYTAGMTWKKSMSFSSYSYSFSSSSSSSSSSSAWSVDIISVSLSTFYKHIGKGGAVSKSWATVEGNCTGVAFGFNNVMTAEHRAESQDMIYVHNGTNAAVTNSFSAPASDISDLDFDDNGNDLISVDRTANKIYIHNGVTPNIGTSFNTPASDCRAVTITTAGNIVSGDTATHIIYFHNGKTAAITATYASSIEITGLGNSGSDDLLECGGTKYYIHNGLFQTISISFTSPGTPYTQGISHD